MGILSRRRAGVLLHLTALPGASGSLGAAARNFVDWLAEAGFSIWQVLPLGPVDDSASPYWTTSDFAFNPRLIDRSEALQPESAPAAFADFCERQAEWLEDYTLFCALGEAHGGASWWQWPAALRDRDTAALDAARALLGPAIRRIQIEQWQATTQWAALREYAHAHGVCMFGDLPIYVTPNSVAVWSQRQQFQLNADGRPSLRAGVPPDYFSVDGQLWGNPVYDWKQAERDGFAFWRTRVRLLLQRFDWLRLDHFRGLESYWAIPETALTARTGHWLPAPGAALLQALGQEHAELPLVAEDLGVITPEVDALRQQFGLPGMRVLQFGFDGNPGNRHLAQNLDPDSIVYTGTHDNDTTLGWYRKLDATTRTRVDLMLCSDRVPMPEALLRAALYSTARLAIAPLQDLVGSGSEARFNTPGTSSGNWGWRMDAQALDGQLTRWLRALNDCSGRTTYESVSR
jgi:4-alpha-glucanotransferase